MGVINIIGLGAGDLDQMPLGVYKTLKQSTNVFLRTKEHPVITELEKEGFTYESFDYIYEEEREFAAVYEKIVATLISKSQEVNVTYAVPGHPLVAEHTVELLLERNGENNLEVNILGGQSFLDNMFQALKIDPINGCQIVDGTVLAKESLQIRQHMIICQVYDAFIASEVKLTLMELLPDDYPVTIVTAAGSQHEKIKVVPLFELDRSTTLNNLTAVYVPPVRQNHLLYRDFHKLRDIISTLRGPNGCPWDMKQTHQSLKSYLIEEAYEVIEAIEEENYENMIEELGDVLLQVMLHSQIGEDDGMFTVDDVIASVNEKMIRRHPHVFGSKHLLNESEVVQQWEEIKKEEKASQNTLSILDTIPTSLPSLLRAYKIQKKAAKVGFDWDNVESVWLKIQEEIKEFEVEIEKGNSELATKEFGDILFAFVNLARYYGIDPEIALQATNNKFYQRFSYIEETLSKRGETFQQVGLEELDEIWEEAKKVL